MSILEAMNEAAQADWVELKWESCYVESVYLFDFIVGLSNN